MMRLREWTAVIEIFRNTECSTIHFRLTIYAFSKASRRHAKKLKKKKKTTESSQSSKRAFVFFCNDVFIRYHRISLENRIDERRERENKMSEKKRKHEK